MVLAKQANRHARGLWTLLGLAWVSFLVAVLVTDPVGASTPGPYGLVSYLPVWYWISLVLVLTASLVATMTKEKVSPRDYTALVLTLGVFLLGVTSFVEPNSRNPDTYQNFAEVGRISDAGQIDLHRRSLGPTYQNWPAAYFLMISLLGATGLPSITFLTKYLPLVWPLYLILAVAIFARRLGLSARDEFLLSYLPLATWTGLDDYPPTFLSLTLFYTAIAIMLAPRGMRDFTVWLLLCAAIVTGHPIVTLSLVLVGAGLSIPLRSVRWFLLLAGLAAGWVVYAAIVATGFIVTDLQTVWFDWVKLFFRSEIYTVSGSVPGRSAARYSLLFFGLIYAGYGLWRFWYLMRTRKRSRELIHARAVMFACLGLVPVAALMGLSEGFVRVLVPSSVLLIAFFLLTQTPRIAMGVLVVVFPILLLFARFSSEMSWSYVSVGALRGAAFFAENVSPEPRPGFYFAYHGFQHLVIFQNPSYLDVPPLTSVTLHRPSILGFDIRQLDAVDYVLLSKQGHQSTLWGFGVDPFYEWQYGAGGGAAIRLYDSSALRVYANRIR
jgi:hypothetical protein